MDFECQVGSEDPTDFSVTADFEGRTGYLAAAAVVVRNPSTRMGFVTNPIGSVVLIADSECRFHRIDSRVPIALPSVDFVVQ